MSKNAVGKQAWAEPFAACYAAAGHNGDYLTPLWGDVWNYGVNEKYHVNQYSKSSGNEDNSRQASLNAKYNGLSVARSHGFIQRLVPHCWVSKLVIYFYSIQE